MWIWILFAVLTLVSIIVFNVCMKNYKLKGVWYSTISMLACGILTFIHFDCWTNRCPNCGKMTAQTIQYCSDCGYELIVTCTNGHNSSYKKSYCIDCGESLAK